MCGFDDSLRFNLTSRVEMPMKEFSEEMEKAGQDIYALFVGEVKAKAKL